MFGPGRNFLIRFVLCGCIVQSVAADSTDLALKHALFYQFQGNATQAYITASYHGLRGDVLPEEGPKLLMTQAGAAFDLGLLDQGIALVEQLNESALLPENRSRLHLYLARDAYRRRDWSRFDSALVNLKTDKTERKSTGFFGQAPEDRSERIFLLAEQARLTNDYSLCLERLNQMFSAQILRHYGLFNLASQYAQSGDESNASAVLEQLIVLPTPTYEHLMLVEQARIALSDIYASTGRIQASREVLAGITATDQYGPIAISRLAQMNMQQGEFAAASRAWKYLLNNAAWNPQTVSAHAAYAFSLSKSEDTNVAIAAYQTALQRVNDRRQRLTELQAALSTVSMSDLLAGMTEGDLSLAQNLAKVTGHDAWVDWFVSGQVQQTAQSWTQLNQAYQSLLKQRDNLNVLLLVDAEQQRTRLRLNQLIANKGYARRVEQLSQRLDSQARAMPVEFSLDPEEGLLAFATDDERDSLQRIAAIEANAARLNRKAPEMLSRIDRLKGKLLFSLWDELPLRIRAKEVRLQAQQAQLEIASQRIKRITRAEQNIPSETGVNNRMIELSGRNDQLLQVTGVALASSTNTLLAGLNQRIEEDKDRLGELLIAIRYDLARLADQRLAAGTDQPGEGE